LAQNLRKLQSEAEGVATGKTSLDDALDAIDTCIHVALDQYAAELEGTCSRCWYRSYVDEDPEPKRFIN
jgi:hypothetical protein